MTDQQVGQTMKQKEIDPINHPAHYTSRGGIECIQAAELFGYCLGNVVKYVWRAGLKSPDPLEDLLKARWYLDREIARAKAGREEGGE